MADSSAYRVEHDSMGEVRVPASALWGAQTQRSHENFPIGAQTMPPEIIRAFAQLKKAAALANRDLGRMTPVQADLIAAAADEVLDGKLDGNFPLVVWQTGSGTQSNMNMNEVLANRGNQIAAERGVELERPLHPNDSVNMSQSSNDTFPTAMHVAAAMAVRGRLLPAIAELKATFLRLEEENAGVVKCGRTHLQDAVPLTLGQEISGWSAMLGHDRDMIVQACRALSELALGGTAVGTGLNAPAAFGDLAAEEISELLGYAFLSAPNKFHALTSKDQMVFAHGALKALAADLMKIANDVRWLASGPRCGLGEIFIPENEPGSSIMPGKVNPVIPEVCAQAAFQVVGNDAAIALASSSGQLELNAFEPVMFDDLFEDASLLRGALLTLKKNCLDHLKVNEQRCAEMAAHSAGLATALSPTIGYRAAAKIAQEAVATGESIEVLLKEKINIPDSKIKELLNPQNLLQPANSSVKLETATMLKR